MTRHRLETAPGVFCDVIDLASEASVDRAWSAYAEWARQLSEDHSLLLDRAFNEELARRHNKWKRLFLIQEAH